MTCNRNLIAEMSNVIERKNQLEIEITRMLWVATMFERDHIHDKREPPPIGTLRGWFNDHIASLQRLVRQSLSYE